MSNNKKNVPYYLIVILNMLLAWIAIELGLFLYDRTVGLRRSTAGRRGYADPSGLMMHTPKQLIEEKPPPRDLSKFVNIPAVLKLEKCSMCNVYKHKRLISPPKVCNGTSSVKLLILVTTSGSGLQHRAAVRSTWATHSRGNTGDVRVAFVIGGGLREKEQRTVEEEHECYGDILQGDFQDVNYNIPNKILLGYKWALATCSFDYVIKTADDNFIHVPRTLHRLSNNKTSPPLKGRVQIGVLNSTAFTKTKKDFLAEHPNYQTGTTYVVSSQLAKDILEKSEHFTYHPHEDIFFPAILKDLGVVANNVSGFNKISFIKHYTSKQKIKQWGEVQQGCRIFNAHVHDPIYMYYVWNACAQAREGVHVTSSVFPEVAQNREKIKSFSKAKLQKIKTNRILRYSFLRDDQIRRLMAPKASSNITRLYT